MAFPLITTSNLFPSVPVTPDLFRSASESLLGNARAIFFRHGDLYSIRIYNNWQNLYITIGLFSIMTLNDDDMGLLTSGVKAIGAAGSSILKAAQMVGLSSSLIVTAPYALTFYYLYRRLFKGKLEKLSMERLKITMEKINVDASKKHNEISELKQSIKLLESDLEKDVHNRVLQLDLRNARENLSLAENQFDELLTAKEFSNSVMLLINRKNFLMKNGMWTELNKISQKRLKSDNERIIKETMNIRQMKDYLLELNGNQEMYKELMRV